MPATLKDVAAAAGVSVKTASNVVNGHVHVSAATRERVERILSRLDYRPNLAARNLRRGTTGLVGVALPSLVSAYHAELAQALVDAARAQDLTVLVDSTGGDPDRERWASAGLGGMAIDGMILSPHGLRPAQLADRRSTTPLVMLTERRYQHLDTIAVDSRAAARTAMAHLIAQGRTRIAAMEFPIGNAPGALEGRRRHGGYRDALLAAGLPWDPTLIGAFPAVPDAVGSALGEFLRGLPDIDAVFCFNDQIALAVMRQLAVAGRKVPDDVAVIGIDDIEAGRYSTPTLSTIAVATTLIAEQALARLRERIDGSTDAPRRTVVAHQLVVRESTGGPVSG